MSLGNAAAARVRLIVWCKACGHRAEPDPAEIAQWYGAETTVPEWRGWLVCSACGSRNTDMVVTGSEHDGTDRWGANLAAPKRLWLVPPIGDNGCISELRTRFLRE